MNQKIPLSSIMRIPYTGAFCSQELSRVPETRGEEALSPLMRKIIYLTEFKNQPFAGHTVIDTVRLYDDGTHGDATASDGVYTGRFKGTSVAGTYAFDAQASGRTASGIPFERIARTERHIAVKADLISTEVLRLPEDAKHFDVFEITLRPADVYAISWGPAGNT